MERALDLGEFALEGERPLRATWPPVTVELWKASPEGLRKKPRGCSAASLRAEAASAR